MNFFSVIHIYISRLAMEWQNFFWLKERVELRAGLSEQELHGPAYVNVTAAIPWFQHRIRAPQGSPADTKVETCKDLSNSTFLSEQILSTTTIQHDIRVTKKYSITSLKSKPTLIKSKGNNQPQ